MDLKNTWVGYLQRSYLQIKNSILKKMPNKVPEITDFSESNPFIILISIFSGIAEMLNYYIDNVAREMFLPTAQRFESVVNNVKLLDYRIKTAIPATTNITFTAVDSIGNPVGVTSQSKISEGTKLETSNGIIFLTTKPAFFDVGQSQSVVPVKQYENVSNSVLGVTDGTANQEISLGNSYAHQTLSITIDGKTWTEVDTFGFSAPNDRHFIVDVKEDGLAYVIFGDGKFGDIPPQGFNIVGDYYITSGALGNNVAINDIDTFVNAVPTLPGADSVQVRNEESPSGGSDYEGVEEIKFRAPISIRTLDRAVTETDFREIVKLAPGVGKSDLQFECGDGGDVQIYIGPESEGIASDSLLIDTKNFMRCRRMVGTTVDVRPAGLTELVINIDARGVYGNTKLEVSDQIKTALVNWGSYENSDVNKEIRLYDLYNKALGDLDKVDFLTVNSFYAIPYARPYNHTRGLNWNAQLKPGSDKRQEWKIFYDGNNKLFYLFRERRAITKLKIGQNYTDPDNIINLTINPGVYRDKMEWRFVTYPYNKDIEIDDFTIPLIRRSQISVDVSLLNEEGCK